VFTGLVFLAVLVTVGIRTNTAAIVAAASYVFLPAVFLTYLPQSVDQLPTALFGLGAIMVARNPDGILAMHRRQVQHLLRRRRTAAAAGAAVPSHEGAAGGRIGDVARMVGRRP
jgi:branched-chain amino acid transport system permease protein